MQIIKVSDRIFYAINEMINGNLLVSLEHASIAVDMTSKKLYRSKFSGRSLHINLLEKYFWILELMSFQGINLPDSKFGNIPFARQANTIIQEPRYTDILYHIIRCGLIHGESPSELTLEFCYDNKITISDKYLCIPDKIIWGLLAIVVFCNINLGESSAINCFFTIHESNNHHKFMIDNVWGAGRFVVSYL